MTKLFLAETFKNKVPVGGVLIGTYDFEVKPVEGDIIKHQGNDYQVISINPIFGGNSIVGFDIFVKSHSQNKKK